MQLFSRIKRMYMDKVFFQLACLRLSNGLSQDDRLSWFVFLQAPKRTPFLSMGLVFYAPPGGVEKAFGGMADGVTSKGAGKTLYEGKSGGGSHTKVRKSPFFDSSQR